MSASSPLVPLATAENRPGDTAVERDPPGQQREALETVEEAETFVEEQTQDLDVEVEGTDAGEGDDVAQVDVAKEVDELRGHIWPRLVPIVASMLLVFAQAARKEG